MLRFFCPGQNDTKQKIYPLPWLVSKGVLKYNTKQYTDRIGEQNE
jgi:hypothetical protein